MEVRDIQLIIVWNYGSNIKSIIILNEKKELEIFTDSKYLKDGIESWIINGNINGWKTSNKKAVKNKEIWIELDQWNKKT